MSEKWQPKVGDECWLKPKRMSRGLNQPVRQCTVYSLHQSGTIGVKFNGDRVKAVNPARLSPRE